MGMEKISNSSMNNKIYPRIFHLSQIFSINSLNLGDNLQIQTGSELYTVKLKVVIIMIVRTVNLVVWVKLSKYVSRSLNKICKYSRWHILYTNKIDFHYLFHSFIHVSGYLIFYAAQWWYFRIRISNLKSIF